MRRGRIRLATSRARLAGRRSGGGSPAHSGLYGVGSQPNRSAGCALSWKSSQATAGRRATAALASACALPGQPCVNRVRIPLIKILQETCAAATWHGSGDRAR